jgi:hypothetical protein
MRKCIVFDGVAVNLYTPVSRGIVRPTRPYLSGNETTIGHGRLPSP